jgi:hypothetical protein
MCGAARKTAREYNVIIHSCVGNSSPNRKLPLTCLLIRVCNRPPQERHRTGLSREKMSLWLAGYPKNAALRRPVWVINGSWPECSACPLQPHKRTNSGYRLTSAACQEQTSPDLPGFLLSEYTLDPTPRLQGTSCAIPRPVQSAEPPTSFEFRLHVGREVDTTGFL